MRKTLTENQEEAIQWLYGGGDEEIVCWSAQWVVTRYPHECYSVYHEGRDGKPSSGKIPAGSRVIVERAKVEGRFGTCYTCNDCLKRAIKEISN
jgi:hypothetical protein